jgi:hypothetical protein
VLQVLHRENASVKFLSFFYRKRAGVGGGAPSHKGTVRFMHGTVDVSMDPDPTLINWQVEVLIQYRYIYTGAGQRC